MELICVVRDVYKALGEFEVKFMNKFGICVNEMIVLCSLSEERLSASKLSEKTGMRASHLSKVIRSAEDKNLITRKLGETDRRQMYFKLTDEGCKMLEFYDKNRMVIPDILTPIFWSKVKKEIIETDENKC